MITAKEWKQLTRAIDQLGGHTINEKRFIDKEKLIELLDDWTEPPPRETVDVDHPSVRQMGTRKQIYDEGVFRHCVLVQIEVKNGPADKHTEVIETWMEEQSHRAQDIGKPPKRIKEHSYLPARNRMGGVTAVEAANNMHTAMKKAGFNIGDNKECKTCGLLASTKGCTDTDCKWTGNQ